MRIYRDVFLGSRPKHKVAEPVQRLHYEHKSGTMQIN